MANRGTVFCDGWKGLLCSEMVDRGIAFWNSHRALHFGIVRTGVVFWNSQ